MDNIFAAAMSILFSVIVGLPDIISWDKIVLPADFIMYLFSFALGIFLTFLFLVWFDAYVPSEGY